MRCDLLLQFVPSVAANTNVLAAEPSVMDTAPADKPRGLRRRIAGLFSSTSPDHQSSDQVAKLKEELRKQSDLKETYRARLESTQEYLRFCLEVAQEHGFLHLVSRNELHGAEAETATAAGGDDDDDDGAEAETPPCGCDPYLSATRDLAVRHGWFVTPEEIELHEMIGRGTTADVHRATWRGLAVSVKWVRPEFFLAGRSGGGAGEAFFAQELDALSRQRHPHVLRLLGACLRPPGSCFVVTELLSGATLGEWLHGCRERTTKREQPPPPMVDRVSRALEVALAMRHLHEQTPRVVHRDLKPNNVLLDGDYRARIADFGHARFLPDGTEALTGETGTYVYMAPEVIRCEPYTEKCDVYSFGIILNELVTAEHPYIDTSYGPSKIALEVADGRLRPKLPEGDASCSSLIDLICRAWDAEPSNRPSFATISSVLGEIKQRLMQNEEQNQHLDYV